MSQVDQQFVVKVEAIKVPVVPSAWDWKTIGIASAVIFSIIGIGVLVTRKPKK